MLPILRLIPVGGVFLAIAILLLALNTPRATNPSARATLQPARGALIDRTEHPEWRQFLIQAALRRAGEVERLRDLRDTVIRGEPPVAIIPAPAPVEAKPEVVEAPAAEAEPDVAEAVSAEPEAVAAKPDIAEAAPADANPEVAAPKVALATPVVEAEPEAAAASPIEAKPEAVEPKAEVAEPKPIEPAPVVAEPKIATAAPVEAKPEAVEPKVAEAAPIEAMPEATAPKTIATESEPAASEPKPAAAETNIAAATPTAEAPADVTPAPVAAEPERATPTQMASIAPAPAPDSKPAAATPSQDNGAAPASPLETNGSRFRPDVTPPADKVAALTAQPVEDDSGDITGSIEPADRTATIPVGIGEASSSELMVTLPRVRPPVLRQLDLRRGRDSKVKQPQRRVHHVSRARKRTTPEGIPPELNIFALLFKAFDPDGNFEPIKPTIPYQPNNSWRNNQ